MTLWYGGGERLQPLDPPTPQGVIAMQEQDTTKRSGQSGRNNPNWRGGRIVPEHGYVMIRVGEGHHLADIRGYAYEHRLVAEKMIGRRLEPKEVVHHKNHERWDNRPENLTVYPSAAAHRVEHRTSGKRRRMPDEENTTVPCECGCGAKQKMFDAAGRFRRFIAGHNLHGARHGAGTGVPQAHGVDRRTDHAHAGRGW